MSLSLCRRRQHAAHSQLRTPSVASPYSANAGGNAGPQSNGKNSSMLDKFKLFNNKDKTDKIKSSCSGE